MERASRFKSRPWPGSPSLGTYPRNLPSTLQQRPQPASVRGQEKAADVCASRLLPAQAPFPPSPWESSGRLQQRAPACINTLTGKRQKVTDNHQANSPLVMVGSCPACALAGIPESSGCGGSTVTTPPGTVPTS